MGIDPGGITGIAVWRGQFPWRRSVVEHYQFEQARAIQWISAICNRAYREQIPLLIGCESFTVRRGRSTVHTPQNTALEVIGAVKTIADNVNAVLSMQTPAVAKRAMPDASLKQFGWWKSHIDYRHANDAARHIAGALLIHRPDILMDLHEQVDNATSSTDQ
jgi:hypothetical protein